MTDPNQGFQNLPTELSAATQHVNQGMQALTGQITSGSVRVDPDGLDECAKFCEGQAQQVLGLRRATEQLARLGGLGDYHVADGLRQHLAAKAADQNAGVQRILMQLHDEMINQANAFRGAAKDYRDREAQIAHDLGKGTQ